MLEDPTQENVPHTLQHMFLVIQIIWKIMFRTSMEIYQCLHITIHELHILP